MQIELEIRGGLRSILTISFGMASEKKKKNGAYMPPTQAKANITKTRYHLTVGALRRRGKNLPLLCSMQHNHSRGIEQRLGYLNVW